MCIHTEHNFADALSYEEVVILLGEEIPVNDRDTSKGPLCSTDEPCKSRERRKRRRSHRHAISTRIQ